MCGTAALATFALIIHIFAAVVWVGGMFFAHQVLRSAAAALEPPSRLVLWSRVFGRFFAWVIADTPVLHPRFHLALGQLATEAADVTFGNAILRGIFAGWLIAMVVWMLAATDSNRIPIIILMTYIVGLAGLTHIVAGSVEVLFLVMTGAKSWLSAVGGYMLPTLIGNVLGGVSLVSALNHAQVIAGTPPARKS